jgi:hypothetical protein
MDLLKNIKGYGGFYKISPNGAVVSFLGKKPRILKYTKDKYGYRYIVLSGDLKTETLYIHRLVAQTFIPNPLKKLEVNHIDLNKENNHVSNLEWNTRIENMNHYKMNKKNKQIK